MKNIRIFIASSPSELKGERFELFKYIHELNDRYSYKGFFLEGYFCLDPYDSTPDSQKMDNDFINNEADAALFMFFHKVDELIMAKLQTAIDAMQTTGSPKIYVFFKAVENGMPAKNDEIQKCVNLISNEYGCYYKIFDDVDTIQSELLQFFLSFLPEDKTPMGEQLCGDGKALVANAKAMIEKLQMDINDPKCSLEIEHAYESAYEAATAVYDYAFICDYICFLCMHNNKSKATCIAKNLWYMYKDPKRPKKTENYDYARLLNMVGRLYADDGRSGRAEEVFVESLMIYRRLSEGVRSDTYFSELASICKTLADIYADDEETVQAEELYLEALAIYRRLADESNGERYYANVAITCNNLANLYADTGRMSEAEKLYLEANYIYNELAEKTSVNEYYSELRMISNNLARLYIDIGRENEAEKLYLEALSFIRRFSVEVKEAGNEPDLALTCNNLASLYTDTGRGSEAEKYYLEALSTYRRLAEKVGAAAYEPYVAITLYNYGDMLKKNGRKEDAKKCFVEAKQIAEKYKDTDAYCRMILRRLHRVGI